jgi:hypothetical protein
MNGEDLPHAPARVGIGPMHRRTTLVTGAATGIGRAIAIPSAGASWRLGRSVTNAMGMPTATIIAKR